MRQEGGRETRGEGRDAREKNNKRREGGEDNEMEEEGPWQTQFFNSSSLSSPPLSLSLSLFLHLRFVGARNALIFWNGAHLWTFPLHGVGRERERERERKKEREKQKERKKGRR